VIENRLVDSYRLQQQASQLNPYIDSTRRRYASTNLAIAVALSNKTDITETERAQVNQLIQQAIREARAASVISPGNSQNWRVLGTIYQNLIGVADSADQWTINTYVTAIETAPTDPTARIALAQVFFSLQQYDQASQLFAQSVNLKADLPNGLYGLANSLKEQGALTQAEQTYQQLLQTVSPSTDAYIQANKELQELRARIASLTEEETATLTEEEAPATDPTSQQPSLLEQTLNQDQNQLVNQPGAEPLPNDPFATDQPAPESNDQDQEATPSGVPQ
jgi:tetratricopeptide (TPR) repeat protein